MRSGSKLVLSVAEGTKRYSFITVVGACFFLWAFVFPIPVYAAGEIVAWGWNEYGQCDVPSPNTGFKAITAGAYVSLGLKTDGSIVAWGNSNYGQCTLPSPNTGFTAIACGGVHSLGLKADGSIVAWGMNTDGQCTVPSPNTGFKAIAASGYHSLGLKQDGSIVAWGDNYWGQCDVPSPNSGFTAIASGWYHSLGLKQDGSIVAWGDHDYGKCDVPSPNSGFTAIACGAVHSLGLKQDGSIVAWGFNTDGQCTVPSPNTGFKAIACGTLHSLGLKTDGSIVGWGDNEDGQATPPDGNNFIAIAAGGDHSLALYKFNGDLSGDAFVNFVDYAILSLNWQQSSDPCEPNNGDIVKNGLVDIYDLAKLVADWLTCLVTPAIYIEPAHQAMDVSRNVILRWLPGENCTSHDIYFGTDFNEVKNADITSSDVYMGNQDVCYWDTNNYDSNGLDLNTTYYWRIDEVAAGCTTKGDVWRFTVNSGKARNPQPSDGQVNVTTHAVLRWSPATDAVSHDVYFGTSLSEVNDANTSAVQFMGNQDANWWDTNNYAPAGLDFNTTYYWRIDEAAVDCTTKSDIWSFTTQMTGLDPNLVSWWKFDEGTGTIAYDSAGHNDGQLMNGPTWTTGKIDGGLSFDGTNDYVECGSGPSNYDNITVSAWMKTSTNGILVSNRYNSYGYGTWYTLSSTDIAVGDNSQGGFRQLDFNTPTLDGAWHHIVYTKNGINHAIYVDGSLDQSFTSNADISWNKPTFIGRRWTKSTDNSWFNGIIDDVRIYSRALSAEEVNQLYQQGL